MRTKRILSIVLALVLLASALPLAITSAAAYEKKIPCDADGNNELTKEELVNVILPYMLGEGDLKLDDVGDAAWVYAYWGGKPKTIVDQADRTVTLYRPVERVVPAGILDGVRTLIQLGAIDKIVGINNYAKRYALKPSRYWSPIREAAPELKDLPDVGGYRNPNMEVILSLKPDVVFEYAPIPDIADTIQENTCIPVICIKSSQFDFEMHRLVGCVVGKEERAEELISYANEEIAKITEVTSEIPDSEKPKVYCISGCGGKSAITKTWGRYDPIDIAGGINVAKEYVISSGSVMVSKEQIIKWNPDIILIHGIFPPHKISIDDVLADPDLQTVNAVKNRNVNYTKGYMIGWDPATGLTECFYFAKLFHSDKFKDLNEEEEGNEILEKFYGVDGLYTKMLDLSDRYRWE